MNPSRVDFAVDLAYGALLFLSVVLIVTVGTGIGIAFGLGSLVAYIVHVGWKMARFDPAWMTQEVAENLEESITEEVTEGVEEEVSREVTETVEEDISEEIETLTDRLEELNERIDRRPRADEIDAGGARAPVAGRSDADERDEDERDRRENDTE